MIFVLRKNNSQGESRSKVTAGGSTDLIVETSNLLRRQNSHLKSSGSRAVNYPAALLQFRLYPFSFGTASELDSLRDKEKKKSGLRK
jgi:hypothetical protein